jgi:arginyl-tRNA synthetase
MKERLLAALLAILRRELDAAGDTGPLPPLTLDVPRQSEHGDFATNAALVLTKRLRRPPREIAQRISAALAGEGGLVSRVEVAGPGFVNVWLSGERWHDLLREILRAGAAFGRSESGGGQRVQVEFVSANPTGPLTLGHGRQAVLGDSLARLLEATGHAVTREFYFNDGGRQMRVLGESVKARYLEQLGRAAPAPPECLADPKSDWPTQIDGLPVAFPKGGYLGAYVSDLAADLRAESGDALVDEPGDGVFRARAEERIFAEFRTTLEALRIHFDVYYNETSLYESGKIEETLADLRAKDLVYDADGAVWLRATQLGLDRDRVLVKSTGEPTYLLPDVAYHREKFRRGFDLVIDVQGADHIDQFPFVRKAAGALGCPEDRIELVMNQFVTLSSGGETMKQSKRRATYVTVDELLGEVGADVFRFFMIQRKADGHLDFDVDLAKEQDWKKNPSYYVQYAHARTFGIERKATEQGVAMPTVDEIDAARLALPEELELLKKLREYPDVIARASESREPHHLAYYLRELAAAWHPYLQDGVRHRVLSDDPELTAARLGLVLAVRTVLAGGLALLGLSTPEQM